jgi:tRNA(Arg) A34 adenosine deaminase TadA
MSYQPDERFMRLAIQMANESRAAGDYAIGAVVVRDNEILSASGNRIILDCDPTQHAEVAAIRMAATVLNSRHLEGAVLYTTAEPCPMCAATAIWARMKGIVSGSSINDMAEFRKQSNDDFRSWRTIDIAAREILDHGEPKLFLMEGMLRSECRQLFHSD